MLVAVIDDDEATCLAVARLLAATGHRVRTFTTARDYLEDLDAAAPSCVLVDIRMPDVDGRTLYQEIEKRWPHLRSRVVFVTGDTLASSLREFVTATGRPVLEKPFLPSEVRRVVADIAANAPAAASRLA